MEKKTDMFEDFCYAHFDGLGRGLLKVFRGVEDNMEAANMKLHPEVYLSIIGFLVCILSTIPAVFFLLLFVEIIPLFLPLQFLVPILLSTLNLSQNLVLA